MRVKTLPRIDAMYWVLVVSSTTLGETAGDFISQTLGFGYGGGMTALLLVALLVITAVLATSTKFSRMGCYWAAIIVTHPLGAALGDFLAKDDGLDLGNALSSAILAVVLAAVAVLAWRLSLRRSPDPQAQ
jgi:uncharacterized membrane-anchored protein